ncbi:Wadjet anti-phage system protein JetD domain-containing protein [Microbulbifer magnicolonia]|uniref:Wadjet anti-phage system protein JetD domain-containing protein n=1 Tax=Microbulbifer magnicolonia TaxID=3109744 RepID=UPI002B40833E|nr:Wadjet anti-phage system protein JetD domain-containing protein [Microbulbifer sp. GG15]
MARQLPEWAAANPVIMGLLKFVLEKRNRQILTGDEKQISITLNPQNPPRALRAALEPFNDPDYEDSLLWDELKWLANEYRCFTIKLPGRRSAGRAPWEGARLEFDDTRETMIREWLDRPRPQRVDPQWQAALNRFTVLFENVDAFPRGGLTLDPGFDNFEQLLGCWASIGEELERSGNLTWRQLSARCFLGDSKYLDGGWRQSLVSALFPSKSDRVRERPLLMHLYLPERTEQVLLIENQDSFLWIADLAPKFTALVYIEGYRGGAARVRAPGIARFSTLNDMRKEARRDFLQWWQGQASRELPVYFWGDLDHEGMHIAAALRRSFEELSCWRPGYQPLLERLRRGGGHLPQQAGKERQKAIQTTGCAYADDTLIPALTESGRSVDQEALTAEQLRARLQYTQL